MYNPGKRNPEIPLAQYIQYFVDELKSIREEVNWRVKIAYTSSVVFLSLASLAAGQLYNSENQFLEHLQTEPELMMLTLNVSVIVISTWVGVQNANHLISSRIELYQLRLAQAIYFHSGEALSTWVAFIYGSPTFHSRTKEIMAKMLTASVGIFQYFFPNILAAWIWYFLVSEYGVNRYTLLFCIGTFCLIVSIAASGFLLFIKMKLTRESEAFYKNHLKDFFDTLYRDFSAPKIGKRVV